jgi:hypothetical protein
VTLGQLRSRTADDLSAAFDVGTRERAEEPRTTAESIFLLSASEWFNSRPTQIAGAVPFEPGGLMAYNSFTSDLQARPANYFDRTPKGRQRQWT